MAGAAPAVIVPVDKKTSGSLRQRRGGARRPPRRTASGGWAERFELTALRQLSQRLALQTTHGVLR